MKKTIAALLSLLIVLSLAACGSQTESVGKIDEEKQQTEQVDSTEQTEADVPAEPTPAFDTSWADGEFERQIPEPPFANWFVVETENENEYLIYAEDVLYTDAKEYGKLLASCAFTKNPDIDDAQDGMWYSLYAANEAGFMLNYVFGAYSYDEPKTGSVEISIVDNRANSAPQGSATSSSGDDAEVEEVEQPASLPELPPLPNANWSEGYDENEHWLYYTAEAELPVADAKAYVQTLKDNGYTKNVVEEENGAADGEDYRFEGYLAGAEHLTMVSVLCHSDGQWTIVRLQVQK